MVSERLMRIATVRAIVAAGLLLAASLALGMPALDEPPSTSSLTPREREAFEYLRSSAAFELPYAGIDGKRPRGYLAMRILRRSLAADDAFKELLRSGTIAGQLYGLCGVYHTDSFAFSAALPRYRRSIESVRLSWACILETKRVADIACAEDGTKFDICSGTFPAAFSKTDHDEAGARKDEKLADFRR
jgi:hypothetical protein